MREINLQSMDVNEPQQVYSFVRARINRMIKSIDNSSGKIKAHESYGEAADILRQQKANVEAIFSELERNAEWKNLTITFFGETKAGKSTIIESLRLHFGEASKQKEQQKFNHLMREYKVHKGVELSHNKQKDLEKVRDGNIVGDGRSDFTVQYHEYEFNINGNKIKLIDAPGIEGNESKVIDKIQTAVKKSHVVFYVVSKNALPNETTINKIKQHLGDQTEVWVIYNKLIHNPRALKDKIIADQDASESMQALEDKMREILQDAYKGYIALYGLVAFYALANCLIPESDLVKNQNKFLKNRSEAGRDSLLEQSQFKNLVRLIRQDIVQDKKQSLEEKIRQSNFNKSNDLILKTKQTVSKVIDIYENMHCDFQKQVNSSKSKLRYCFMQREYELNNSTKSILDKSKRQLRDEMYDRIDDGLSNPDFKDLIQQKLDTRAAYLTSEIDKQKASIFAELNINIKEITEELTQNIHNVTQNYEIYLDANFQTDFNIKNGIDKLGLAGGIVALGGSMLASGVLMGLGVVAGIVSIGKAVWSWLDPDYAKSEQRRNTDKNIQKFFSKLEIKLNQGIEEQKIQLSDNLKQLENQLDKICQPVESTIEDLKKAHSELAQISCLIINTTGA
ncbi:GTPase [Moraxella atlantae]|uniref:GTPase n=1 Tax=Faucicola atlantae TaxID=34059 RepID=UPI003752DDCD